MKSATVREFTPRKSANTADPSCLFTPGRLVDPLNGTLLGIPVMLTALAHAESSTVRSALLNS